MIRVMNDATACRPPRQLLQYWCLRTIRAIGLSSKADILIGFVSRARIQSLYGRYGARNKPTAVLAFPWRESEFPGINDRQYLGEIIIAPSVVANKYGSGDKIFRSALRHITVHATLHLLGFDHATPSGRRDMEQVERRVLGNRF